MKRKSKLLLGLATSVLSLGFCVAGGVLAENNIANAEIDGSLFEVSYDYGETIKIPEHLVQVGNEEVATTPVIIYPDGSAVSGNAVKLDMPGEYQVEYRATVAEKTYKDTYTFIVDYPLYLMSGKSDTAIYGTAEVPEGYETSEGLIAKMAAGSTLQFNSVIDLETITKNDQLFSFQILPTVFGTRDCTDIIVRLTDACDPTNYVEIDFWCSNEHLNVIYTRIKASNQEKDYGSHNGDETTALQHAPYGFAARGSFYGYEFGTANNELGIRYDKEKQIFYLDYNYVTGGSYLADLNREPFDVPWNGFTSGKVKLSFYGSGFVKNTYGLLVTEVAQTNLQDTLVEIKPSDVIVDYGEYTAKDYPNAVVGQTYPIFGATTENLFPGEQLKVKVYQAYGTSNASNVDIVKGCFIPRDASLHTIEYTSIDCFGQEKVFIVPVEVNETAEEITFSLDQTAITIGNGDYLNLPVASDFNGGNGNLKLNVTLLNKGTNETQNIETDTIRFTQQGEYELIYKVSDYNSFYTEKKISVTVTEGTKPYFIGEPLLPNYYIKGGKYAVPSMQAEDYTSNEMKLLDTTVTLKKNGEEAFVADGNYFVVPDSEYIEISFTAVDTNGNTAVLKKTVPVVDVGFDGELNMAKYFYTEDGVVTAMDKYLSLTTTNETASFAFIRELDGDNFSMTLKVMDGKANFGSVRLTLTDYVDKTKVIDINVINVKGVAYISVNGQEPINTGNSIENSIRIVEVTLNKASLMFGDTRIKIAKYLEGTAFDGFDSFVYLTITMEDVTGDTELQVSRVNRQTLSNMKSDVITPNIFFDGNYGGEQDYNSMVTLNPVYAVDVLDPYSEIACSIYAPSGDYVVAKDGTKLQNVTTAKIYQFVVNEYGRYRCVYNYTDSKGNSSSFTYVMQVNDKAAPTVNVQNASITGKVGQEITISGYEVIDNMAAKDKVTVCAQLITSGSIKTLSNLTADKVCDITFTPEKAGVYTVRIFVFDENYNSTYVDITCLVK